MPGGTTRNSKFKNHIFVIKNCKSIPICLFPNQVFRNANTTPSLLCSLNEDLSTGNGKKQESNIFNGIDIPSYIYPWINLCYYILLVPFKISIAQKQDQLSFCITTNLIQKVLCGILHPIICLHTLLEIRGTLFGKSQNDPCTVLYIADRTNSAIYPYVFFFMIWFRRDLVFVIFKGCDPKRKAIRVTTSMYILSGIVIALSVFAFVSTLLLSYNMEYLDFEKFFRIYRKRLQYELGITSRDSQPNFNDTINGGEIISVGISFWLRGYKWVLVDLLGTLMAIGAFVCYMHARLFNQYMHEQGENEVKVFESYDFIKIIFNNFNAFLGKICILRFGSLVTFFVLRAADILSTETWNLPIVFGGYLILQLAMILLSAEAHYQVNYFKTWLFSHPLKGEDERTISLFLEAKNCNLAIRGDRFFNITYGFLGTAVSVLATNAIIMVQFMGNSSRSFDKST